MSDQLYRVGDESAMDPDDWIDQLLASGALVEVTVDYEAAWLTLGEVGLYGLKAKAREIADAALRIKTTA